jgi:glycosyltransferase involved in cell wall biosynthesis
VIDKGIRLCIQWPTLGPYHIARLRAAAKALAPRGIDVVGFEIASRDRTYGFSSDEEGDGFARFTVFPDAVLEDLSPVEIRGAVRNALDQLDPHAVAITSYASSEARSCLEWCSERKRIAILMTATKADDAPRSRWRERLKSILLRGYDAAVVGGSPQEAYIVSLGFPKDRIFHGYDVVDNDWIVERVSEIRSRPDAVHMGQTLPGLDTDTPFFLASARMTQRKNYPGLIAAYAEYRRSNEMPWRLIALGDGPLRSEIESSILLRSIEGITLAGFRPYEQLPHYYAGAGAFVHAAHLDQWGLVVNEAMAAGLPVLVSTGSGCVTDLVQEGMNGYSFESTDTERLSHLMAKVSSDESLRRNMGSRSKEISDDWHPDRFGNALVLALESAKEVDRSRFDPIWSLTIRAIRWLARSSDSFYTVRP